MSPDRIAPTGSGTRRGRPLVLAPFRGLRFDEAAVGDLGTVISPPYDVLDADIVRELEAGNRRNIVRLILSRRFERPYLAVRRRLESWRARGFLVADAEPGLYLYEYTVAGVTVRGLIGLVALRDEAEGVILPHEDVMPAPVEDRTVLMRTTETNLEPILLVHEGTDDLRRALEGLTAGPPRVDFVAVDGSAHRLWVVTDDCPLERIRAGLTSGRALIADGHHRYAAYQQLQGQLRAPGAPDDTDPWDFGLAMLVDQNDYPLTVGPIHRSVASLTISDVEDLAAERGDELVVHPDRDSANAAVAARRRSSDDTATFVVSDGRVWAVLTCKRRHEVDAAVLHEDLLPAWHAAEEQIGYHHSVDQALYTTARTPGIVVVVDPPDLRQVMESAARGARMPRKSTSFSPKPRMGLVMRDLRDA